MMQAPSIPTIEEKAYIAHHDCSMVNTYKSSNQEIKDKDKTECESENNSTSQTKLVHDYLHV